MARTIYMYQNIASNEQVAIIPHSPEGDFDLRLEWRLYAGKRVLGTFEDEQSAADKAHKELALPADLNRWFKKSLVTFDWV